MYNNIKNIYYEVNRVSLDFALTFKSELARFIITFTWTTVPQVFRLKWRLMWVPLEMPRQEVLDRKSSSPPTRSLGTETSMELGSHCTGTAHKTNVKLKSTNLDRKRAKGRRERFSSPWQVRLSSPNVRPRGQWQLYESSSEEHPWLQPPFTLSHPSVSTQDHKKPQCMS